MSNRGRRRHNFVSHQKTDNVRSFLSRGLTELKDLSPSVRSLSDGVSRLIRLSESWSLIVATDVRWHDATGQDFIPD